MRYILQKGFKSINGQIEILDSDSLCYLVKNNSKGISGIRTISKALLEEYVDYFEKHPHNTSQQARDDLTGKTAIDKFEYGYTSTLTTMARMVIGDQLSSSDKTLSIPQSKVTNIFNQTFQLIYYGAPGTGKSHKIKQVCQKYEHYRITFHPDTDYASFVGSYKPVTHSEQVYTNMGDKAIPLKDSVTGEPVTTTKITTNTFIRLILTLILQHGKNSRTKIQVRFFLLLKKSIAETVLKFLETSFNYLTATKMDFRTILSLLTMTLKRNSQKNLKLLMFSMQKASTEYMTMIS